jgi:hypothetical protein
MEKLQQQREIRKVMQAGWMFFRIDLLRRLETRG